jgi:hypothetical protein
MNIIYLNLLMDIDVFSQSDGGERLRWGLAWNKAMLILLGRWPPLIAAQRSTSQRHSIALTAAAAVTAMASRTFLSA